MENAALLKTILLAAFSLGGILMIFLGIMIWRKLWGGNSAEVKAECIDINLHTEVLGTVTDRTYLRGAKRPVYRYYYGGREYTSSPLLSSNRSGYRPKCGPCTIRINPKHPEKIYSSERKFAALILIGIGAAWLAVAAVAALLLKA